MVCWPSLFGQDSGILTKFVFGVFMDRGEGEVHKHAKKEQGQYFTILTVQAWPIKDLFYGFTVNNDAWVMSNSDRAR